MHGSARQKGGGLQPLCQRGTYYVKNTVVVIFGRIRSRSLPRRVLLGRRMCTAVIL